MDYILNLATKEGLALTDRAIAEKLDKEDELAHLRDEFHYPKKKNLAGANCNLPDDEECIYLCGNSLGLQPKRTAKLVQAELDKWSKMALGGHFHGDYPWYNIDEFVVDKMAKVVGAKPIEVAVMNSLSVNLHLLMVPFYRPSKERSKILVEANAFPSDHYAVESQIKFHGYDPADALIALKPSEGEDTLKTEDIVDVIEREGDSIALVMFGGVQFFTGQFFDMKTITEAAHRKGCVVGFDLAHAVGNAILKLHDWNVDFACWCTYKYLNSGPGCIAGAFIHENHAHNFDLPKFTGWWGHDSKTRFEMTNEFSQIPGAAGYQISNPGVLATVCLLGSLQIFDEVGMEKLREKSLKLTGYLEALLIEEFDVVNRSRRNESNNESSGKAVKKNNRIKIVTPADPEQRGCQLSLEFLHPLTMLSDELEKRGVVVDLRRNKIMRVSPAPLYNSFLDVWTFVRVVRDILN